MKNLNSLMSVIAFLCFTLFSCTKDQDLLTKNEQEGTELKANRSSVLRIDVKVRGNQMVPEVSTSTVGHLVFDLRSDKKLFYRLELFKLEPGDFATTGALYIGDPGQSIATSIFLGAFPFGPNDVTQWLQLTDEQYDGILFALNPPPGAIAPLPFVFFVINTTLHPTGLLRGAYQQPI